MNISEVTFTGLKAINVNSASQSPYGATDLVVFGGVAALMSPIENRRESGSLTVSISDAEFSLVTIRPHAYILYGENPDIAVQLYTKYKLCVHSINANNYYNPHELAIMVSRDESAGLRGGVLGMKLYTDGDGLWSADVVASGDKPFPVYEFTVAGAYHYDGDIFDNALKRVALMLDGLQIE